MRSRSKGKIKGVGIIVGDQEVAKEAVYGGVRCYGTG